MSQNLFLLMDCTREDVDLHNFKNRIFFILSGVNSLYHLDKMARVFKARISFLNFDDPKLNIFTF